MFTKHTANPIMGLGASGTWEDVYVYKFSVIYSNHKWYMYYSGHDGTRARIGLATSLDGITWTKYTGNPVLTIGAGGTWDDAQLYNPSVIYSNNKWYMYYSGYDGANAHMGLATSLDGITWTKHTGNPVLTIGTTGTWDDAQVYYPSVIYSNNKWYMYYSGHDGTRARIGLATSLDGITWTKYTGNPVLSLGASGTWDDLHIYYPSVIYRNHKWYMYYSAHDGANIRTGLATSLDGITWTKYTGNPILAVGAGGTWDGTHVYKPSVICRNNKWYMYYSGHDGTNVRIGLATSPTGV